MNLLKQVELLVVEVSTAIIQPRFGCVNIETKMDGSLVTDVDKQTHLELCRRLTELADYPVLSEEMAENEQLVIIENEHSSYWCIDPIDGTTNFVFGLPYSCISIALIIEGEIKLGVVYDFYRHECFSAGDTREAKLNGQTLMHNNSMQVTELKDCLGLIDFKRLPLSMANRLISDPPYRSQRSFGASALDLCWIAAQRCHLYLHGRQKLWDYAAGLLILKQAGGLAETIQGEVIFQNNLTERSVIAASTESLMYKWRSFIQKM